MCWWMELSKQGYGLLVVSNKGALFHLCVSLCTSIMFNNQVDCIARDVRVAVTGIADVCVTHMLYADDLNLTANEPGQLQMMLDRLSAYALRKGLIVKTSKSEVVHFYSQCTRVPVFTLGGSQLANKDSFKYLGVIFTKTHNMAAAAEHMLTHFMAGFRRIRQFASEHRLTDRPHSMLCLAKGYALPASMSHTVHTVCKSNMGH